MMDLNKDSNSCSWPLHYGEKTLTNGYYYNHYLPRAIADVYPAYDKDVVKQTMLEHEATFRNQLCELHRLYRIQRNLMDEAKMKEVYNNHLPVHMSLSSSPRASRLTSEDARKWHVPNFPLGNSVCGGVSILGGADLHSSSMKGSSAQASPLPSQNGCSLKDIEITEFRPTKVRRKMFNLQLPADEYIDTEEGEQLNFENSCGITSYLQNRTNEFMRESSKNMLVCKGGKNKQHGDELQSQSFLNSKNNLADLNEPIDVEDPSTSINDLPGCSSFHCDYELATKAKTQFFGFPQEISLNSHCHSNNGNLNHLHLQNEAKGQLCFPHMLDSGHCKSYLKSFSQCLQPEMTPSSSQSIPILLNKTGKSAAIFHSDESKVYQLRKKTIHGSELSEINNEISDNNPQVSLATSNIPSRYFIDPSSDLSNSWSLSISSREKLGGSLCQKSMSIHHSVPYLNSFGTLNSSQSSIQSHAVLGDRWNSKGSTTSNARVKNEVFDLNGFSHGSSSVSRELRIQLPSGNCNFLNCSSASNVAPARFSNHGLVKFCGSSNFEDMQSLNDVHLNTLISNDSLIKKSPQLGSEVIDLERNQEDHPVTLSWLRTKPSRSNGATNAGVDLNIVISSDSESSLNLSSSKTEARKVLNEVAVHSMSSACPSTVEGRTETCDSSSCRKILGIPIFKEPHVSELEPSSLNSRISSCQPSEDVENNNRSRDIDINIPCDPAVLDWSQETKADAILVEKEIFTQVARGRHQIDLNSCITDDEALMLSGPVSKSNIVSGIDLEAPSVPKTEEDVIPGEDFQEKGLGVSSQSPRCEFEGASDEFARIAAEAMVAISMTGYHSRKGNAVCSQPEASMTDPLQWFVGIASSFGEDLESKCAALGAEDNQDDGMSSSEDYLEIMTLKLAETKEEDYLPKPLVLEDFKLKETGTTLLTTRTRRGQGRRGRWRDFQRDILPGLASLSRHEVTEDLQTLGDMMRATGQLWHSGLTRRNASRSGCGRGRRRSVISSPPAMMPSCSTPLIQQLNNVEVRFEDKSVTGWGKTPRRPRQQRCSPGNFVAVPSTES